MIWSKAARQARREREDAAILAVLAEHPAGLSGYPISRMVGAGAGRIYPSLARLEQSGAVASWWEQGEYPRRRLYGLAGSE